MFQAVVFSKTTADSCNKFFEMCSRMCVLEKQQNYNVCMQNCYIQFRQCKNNKK